MTKVSVKKAQEEWGEHLVVASLSAVKKSIEAEEWRVVYDATHGVGLKNKIWAGPDTLPSLDGFGGVLGRDGWRRDGYALLGYLRRLEGPSMNSHSAYRVGLACEPGGQLGRYSTSR